MSPRTPARRTYDAIVDLDGAPIPSHAYALIKRTWRIDRGALSLDAPLPLEHDLRDPKLQPRLPPSTDFWPHKAHTDVVVQGAAWAPDARPVASMEVRVDVGPASRRAAVFGRRFASRANDRTAFTAPERFEQVPLTWDRAYGGADLRVPVGPEFAIAASMGLDCDHPGVYPRNPLGRGYVVEGDPFADVELPQVEDPDDLLTPERFVVGDPRAWSRQPLPVCFDWSHPIMLPRLWFFGFDAYFPVDDAQLPEVARGWVPAGLREALARDGSLLILARQSAAPSMVFRDLAPGAPIAVRGMHPSYDVLRFPLPPPPDVVMRIEHSATRVQPRLHQLVILPDQETVTATWGVERSDLPRAFIPGVHGHIPLSVSVDGDAPLEYVTPTPIRERLRAAQQAAARDGN